MSDMKPSGISWIGDIPSDWSIARIKDVLVDDGKGFFAASEGEPEGKHPFFSSGSRKQFTDEPTHSGEYLIIGDGGVFNAAYYNGQFSATGHCLLYKGNSNALLRFVHYYLSSQSEVLNELGFSGIGIRNINRGYFLSYPIPLPPLSVQSRIVEFLVSRCGVIDKLISEKEKLVEVLREKRKVLISEVVTKGLPEEREGRVFRDSGVEWIGEIPNEWTIVKAKTIARFA